MRFKFQLCYTTMYYTTIQSDNITSSNRTYTIEINMVFYFKETLNVKLQLLMKKLAIYNSPRLNSSHFIWHREKTIYTSLR